MLPEELQWAEEDPCVNSAPYRSSLFTTNLDVEPLHYPYLYDIQVVLLRSRYYYAKYIVYRPSVYKALHFPEEMVDADAQEVAECLHVSPFLFFVYLLTQQTDNEIGLPHLANTALSCFTEEAYDSIPILLVPELSWHPPNTYFT